MSRINSGILHNASPLSAEAINELERKVLETGETYAYLDQNSKLCFAMPRGVDSIKKLAWSSAYTINNPIKDGPCIRQAYKKTGLESSIADKLFTKPSVNADWTECDPAKFEADYEYTVTNGEATITSYIGDGGDIIVPNRLGGYPVVAIDDQAFTYAYQITSVIIMEGITSIGANAFFYCDCIRSMYIPSSVTYIGSGAFEGCCAMTDITLLANITTINANTFNNCAVLTDIVIPKGVTSIGDYAFQSAGLHEVTIPSSVQYLGAGAFNSCSDLQRAKIYANIKELPSDLFYCCPSLSEVVLPETLEVIGTSFGDCACLRTIELPDSVYYIGMSAFNYCTSLDNIVLGPNVVCVDACAFQWCTELTNIDISQAPLQYIGYEAFSTTNIRQVDLTNSLMCHIDERAFADCDMLWSVTIPLDTTIGPFAFDGCTNLYCINFLGTKEIWRERAIHGALYENWADGSSITYIQCTDGAVDLNGNPISLWVVPENCTYYQFVSHDEDSIEYTAGSVVAAAPSLHDSFYDGELAYEYVDEDSESGKAGWNICGYISDSGECQIRTEINNAPVVSIGPGAFMDSNITSLVIPDSVVYLYDGAFADCTELSSITFTGTAQQWRNIIARNPNWSEGSRITSVFCFDMILNTDGNQVFSPTGGGGSND